MNEITADQMDDFIKRDKTGLVYFYTPMCGTCQVAGKMLTILVELFPDLTIAKMNANFSPEISSILEIESVPCLLMIRNGVVKEKIYAFQSVPYLYEKIKTFS